MATHLTTTFLPKPFVSAQTYQGGTILKQPSTEGPLSATLDNRTAYAHNTNHDTESSRSTFQNPDLERVLSKNLKDFFSGSDPRLVELKQKLENQSKDTEKTIPEEEILAGMIYNLLRGTEDVRKNIPLAASYLLSDRDPREVLKIATQEILPFGVVEYFWPKILMSADPSLSTSFILRSLSVSKEENFAYNSKWLKKKLQMMSIESASEIIHGMVLKQGYEEVEEILVLLDDDFQIEVISLLRHQCPEIYPDPNKVKIGKGYIQRKKAKRFVNPLTVYFERQEGELKKLLKSEAAAEFFSKDAREKLLKSKEQDEFTLEDYMLWEKLGAELELYHEVQDKNLKELILTCLIQHLPDTYKLEVSTENEIKIITEDEQNRLIKQSLKQPEIIDHKKTNFGLSKIKNKKTKREKSIFENRAVEQILLYNYSRQPLYAYHLLKSSSDEVREKVLKLINTEDLARILESVTSYESLLEYFAIELELSEEELLHGFKVIEAFLGMNEETKEEFTKYMLKTERGNHVFKSILRLGMLGKEDMITGLREIYEKATEKEDEEETSLRSKSIVEYLLEKSPITTKEEKKHLRRQRNDSISSYRKTLELLKELAHSENHLAVYQKMTTQLKVKEISNEHLNKILPYLIQKLKEKDINEENKKIISQLLLELKKHQEDIGNKKLKEELKVLIINKAQPTKRFWRVSEEKLKDLIQARDENSREALKRYLFICKKSNQRAHLSGFDLSGFDLSRFDLKNADLREADLREADLREADLREASLWKADLREADLREADLREADLREASLWKADLWKADLREASLWKADLWKADLRKADLREADLREAYLRKADLREVDLREADLREADLWKAYFSLAYLDEAKFQRANLIGATIFTSSLARSDLTEADLTGAVLDDVDLTGAILKDSILKDATLSLVKLRSANMIGADLTETVFNEVDFIRTHLNQKDFLRLLQAGIIKHPFDVYFPHDDLRNLVKTIRTDESLKKKFKFYEYTPQQLAIFFRALMYIKIDCNKFLKEILDYSDEEVSNFWKELEKKPER